MRTFNGSNQSFGRTGITTTPTGDDVSFCARVKPGTLPTSAGNDQGIFTLINADTNVRGLFFAVAHDGTRQQIRCHWSSAYATYQDRYRYMADNSAKLVNGTTSVIAGKLNQTSGAMKVWIDGTELDTGSGSGAGYNASFTALEQIYIGQYPGFNRFNGSIGRVFVWLGEALSDANLLAISRGAEPRQYGTVDHGIVLRYTNQATSDNELDLAGNTYTQANSPGVEVDTYGLIFPPVSGRLQELNARMGAGIQ